jgi:capsular exopolysaccharide synthesis family protein
MDVSEYLRILRSRWVIVLATVFVALAAAWLTTSVANIATSPSTVYQASTVLLNTGTTGGLSLNTVASLAEIEPVAAAVAEQVDYPGKPLDLTDDITVLADDAAGTLTITATSPTAKAAKLLGDTWTAQLLDYLNNRNNELATTQAEAIQVQLDQLTKDIADIGREIAATPDTQDDLLEAELSAKTSLYGSLYQQQQTALSTGLQPVGLEVLQEATPVLASTGGFQPPRSRTARMLIALVLGLLLGVGLALLVERARSPIRTKQAAEEHFGYPVIAEIPPLPWGRKKVVVAANSQSRAAHAFRLLAATLSRLQSTEGISQNSGRGGRGASSATILVTSPGPSEGKTTVVANLSAALADLGKRVLVLSCDFHRPLVHEFFCVPATPGLAESLASSNGQSVLAGSVWESSIDDVGIVPSGRRPTKPGELLNSGNMRRALDEAQRLADVVILDTAPLLAEGDVAHLLPAVEGVLVVARAGQTTSQVAERAHEFLQRLGAPVIGVVLTNAAEIGVPRRYYGYSETDSSLNDQQEATRVGPDKAPTVGDFPDSRDS